MSKKQEVQKNVSLPWSWTIAIAGFSGMFAWIFSHPFELWKNTALMAPSGTSQISCLRNVWERGPFTGLPTGLLRQIVYAPARLGCYPIFRDAIMSVKGNISNGSSTVPSLTDRALAGALSGVFASLLSSPVEVCLVLQTTGSTRLSIFTTAAQVYAASGISGYWRGVGALASRSALVGICQVAVHDQTLTYLRRQNMKISQRKGVAPYGDKLVVNVASVCTALFYAFCTMPVEVARVRMSSEARKGKLPNGKASEIKYKNVLQTIFRITREEGALSIYNSFIPYFCRCAMHTIICFFAIEYLTQHAKLKRASV